ncbi:MAG TPA: DUF6492 family protein [Polyangiaceae bacterium]|nr:DUF6492 family protein [Polyangiaceae bacterium]
MTFAIVTPSYVLDYERCVLLNESIQRWVPPSVHHYIIVDARDEKLFSSLRKPGTEIILQEDIVPKRFFTLPFVRKYRFSWNTLPIRGWMWQQVVKLSIARAVLADVFVMTDSDNFFAKPFDPATHLRDGKVPLYREQKPYYETHEKNQEWHGQASRLLGLPRPEKPFDTGYVGHPVFWRGDVLRRLDRRLSRGRGTGGWISDVGSLLTFSEFVLYGLYVEKVEGFDRAGHYPVADLCHSHWLERPLELDELRAFRDEMPEEKILCMINGKSGTDVKKVRKVFFER